MDEPNSIVTTSPTLSFVPGFAYLSFTRTLPLEAASAATVRRLSILDTFKNLSNLIFYSFTISASFTSAAFIRSAGAVSVISPGRPALYTTVGSSAIL